MFNVHGEKVPEGGGSNGVSSPQICSVLWGVESRSE